MSRADAAWWAKRLAWERQALKRVLEIFPHAQIDDTDGQYYTEIADNGTAYVHGVGAYPYVIPHAVEPWLD